MEFSGTFTLDDRTMEEVWLALSDPNLIWHSLPGCVFLVKIEEDDPDFDALREEYEGTEPELTADPDAIGERAFQEGDRYAAILELSVGSVSPSFRTTVTIDEREQPRMSASGEGSAGNSSFEMDSGMELSDNDGGVDIDWHAEADVFGRIAQMGQRMLNPVANRVVKRFFGNVQDNLDEVAAAEAGDGSEATDGGTASGTERQPGAPDGDEHTGGNESNGLLARIKRFLGIGG